MTEDQIKPILLFDFDGTLADTLSIIVEIINDVGPQYKLRKIDPGELKAIRAMSSKELIKYSGLPLRRIPFFIRRVQLEMKNSMKNVEPFPDIPVVLKSIKNAGFQMDILTSNLKDNVEKFLEKNDLLYFEDIYVCSNLFGKKRMLEKIIKYKKLDRKNVIYFGDEIRDIDAAREAGIKIAAVTWGFNDEKSLKINNPDYLISEPKEIKRLLKISEE